MHNFVVDGDLTKPQLHTNMDILERNCNADFYSVWRDAVQLEDAAFGATPTYVIASSTAPAHWDLADSVVSGVSFYVRRHTSWVDGGFDLKIHWSTDSKGGGVRFGVDVNPVVANSTWDPFSAAGGFTSTSANLGSSVLFVDTLSSDVLRRACRVDPSHVGYHVMLRRTGNNAADTNTGTVSLYGIELLYKETRRNTGGTVKL